LKTLNFFFSTSGCSAAPLVTAAALLVSALLVSSAVFAFSSSALGVD
jgi:hypothetical protein